MKDAIVFVAVFIINTLLLLPPFVTYAYSPEGEKATPFGSVRPGNIEDDMEYAPIVLSAIDTQ